ncbi:Uncharacterized protein LW93_4669 [Fusarium fujikuroi]|nr:Uncharacterized protein LW93_4669 [Fusarium fujikuroi]
MDCSPSRLRRLVSDEKVEFDADIAGPGVLAAFLITSLIALATLILAFLTISVPARLLNSGDAVIAAGARRTYHRLRAKFPKTKRTKAVQSRTERTHAFMAFMIAISDQILVSQASILIAALIIHDDITIYSSNIVIALGCLASTVHLGSFPFYIDRIRDHSTAKIIRVLAMITGSGMLVFLLVVQLSYTWDMETHVYFICTLRNYRMNDEMGGADYLSIIMGMFVPLTVLYGTYEIVQLLYRNEPADDRSNEPEPRSYKQKLKSIEKARVDQATFEIPVIGNLRSQSRGQYLAQRQNPPEETDIARIRIVQDVLKKRAKDIGYPELYNWVTGDNLTSAPSLQMGVAVHAAVMFTVATLLGFSMAYEVANMNITLIAFLFVLAARRLIGLCSVGLVMRSCPMILDHLGCTGHLPSQQSGNQGERMAVAQAAGDAGEDLEDQGRQEEP